MESRSVLQCILVSEFHQNHGKQIIQSYPQHSQQVNNESFGLIAQLILPRDELCGKFLALEFHRDYFLMGIPTLIRGETYTRSKYIYSVLMLVRKEMFLADRDTYYEMNRKVSYFFAILEQQRHVLYNGNKKVIRQLLKTMFQNFNTAKECFLEVGCENYMFVSAKSPLKLEAIHIKPEQVPITSLNETQINLIEIPEIHSIMMEVLKGEECVKKIAINLSRSFSDVSDYLKVAISYGMVVMVDLFNIKNVYVLTQKIHEFTKDEAEWKKMRDFCRKMDSQRPSPQQLLYIVLCFNRSRTVQDIFKAHIKTFERVISMVKLVRFCLVRGIIRRCYEIAMVNVMPHKKVIDRQFFLKYLKSLRDKDQEDEDNALQNTIRQKNEEFIMMVKSHATLEEFMVTFMIDRETVLGVFRDHGIDTLLCS